MTERFSITVPDEMAADVRKAIEDGKFRDPADYFTHAVRYWKDAEIKDDREAIVQGLMDVLEGHTKDAGDVLKRLRGKYQAMIDEK